MQREAVSWTRTRSTRLTEGRLKAAVLDVFAVEPPSQERMQRFAGVEHLLLTPHVAGVTTTSQEALSRSVGLGVLSVLEGREPERLVNSDSLLANGFRLLAQACLTRDGICPRLSGMNRGSDSLDDTCIVYGIHRAQIQVRLVTTYASNNGDLGVPKSGGDVMR